MYFKIVEEDKKYFIKMTDNFYHFTTKFYKKDSYFNIFYRLFNLLPQDFYHYVGYKYNAFFQRSSCITFVKIFFNCEKDAREFCKELNRRFDYCVKRGDFD